MGLVFAEPKGPCPVCGAALCTCKGGNEPYVGTPLSLAAFVERSDGTVTRIRAKEKIYRDKPGIPGARELLYNEGDYIRDEDAKALGLLEEEVKPKAAKAPAKKAAAKGPRDKALRGPRETPKEETSDG